jgi:F-type H+-transporting ATPase subunit b
MFQLNGTCVVFIFLFLVFIQLLNKIMLQPIGAALDKRAARLKENLDATRSHMQETEKMLADYQAQLHASRHEAQTIIHSTMADAKKVRDEKLKGIQAEGREKLDGLQAELDAGRKTLVESLVQPEIELVRNILNKLLGETPALMTNEERVFQVLENTR